MFVAAIVALSGCQAVQNTLAGMDKPTARVTGVQFADLSLQSIGLVFDVEVQNPYSVGLPLLGMDVALSSKGQQFLSGASEVSGVVPAKGLRTIPVRTSVTFAGLLGVLKAVKPGALVPYVADLTLSVDAPAVGKLALPLSKEGELPIPAVPSVSLKRIEWKKLQLDEAQAVFYLDLGNTNSFALDLGRFDYDLSLGGHRVAGAKLAQAESFAAGASKTLGIPFSLRPLDLGLGAFNLLRGKDAGYGIRGSLAVKTPFGRLDMPYSAEGKVPLIGGG